MDADHATMDRWVSEVVVALEQGHPERGREQLQDLVRRAPQDKFIGMLRRWAAVLEFDWPAARTPVAVSRRAPPPADAIDLVLFHIDLPTAPSGQHAEIDYLGVATLTFAQAAQCAPQARRILLTDERTRVPADLGAHEVVRQSIDARFPMYERMRVQERYLAARPAGRATVFMDVDVAPNRDPAGLFAEDFDVGLTWRSRVPDAPINGGLIFVGSGERGLAFFRQALSCYDALVARSGIPPLFAQDLRTWWGDQFALAIVVGNRNFIPQPPEALTIDDVRVRLLPSADYNFTPEPGQSYPADFLATRHFLHFKGNRKAMQAEFLDRMKATGLKPVQ